MSDKSCVIIHSRPGSYDLADVRSKIRNYYSKTGSIVAGYMVAMSDEELNANVRMMDNLRSIVFSGALGTSETTEDKELQRIAAEVLPPKTRNVIMFDGRMPDASITLDASKENVIKTKKAFIVAAGERGKYSVDVYVFDTGEVVSEAGLKEKDVYKMIQKYE
jgi:hypothetical protein